MPIDISFLESSTAAGANALISCDFGAAIGPLTALLKVVVETVNGHDALLAEMAGKLAKISTSPKAAAAQPKAVAQPAAAPAAKSAASEATASDAAAAVPHDTPAAAPARRIPSPKASRPEAAAATRATPLAGTKQSATGSSHPAAFADDASDTRQSPMRRPAPMVDEGFAASLLEMQNAVKAANATILGLQKQLAKLQAQPFEKVEADVKALRKTTSDTEDLVFATRKGLDALETETAKQVGGIGKRLDLVEVAAIRSASNTSPTPQKKASGGNGKLGRSQSGVYSPADLQLDPQGHAVLSAQQKGVVEMAFDILKRRIDGIEYLTTSHTGNKQIHGESQISVVAELSQRVLSLQTEAVVRQAEVDRQFGTLQREMARAAAAKPAPLEDLEGAQPSAATGDGSGGATAVAAGTPQAASDAGPKDGSAVVGSGLQPEEDRRDAVAALLVPRPPSDAVKAAAPPAAAGCHVELGPFVADLSAPPVPQRKSSIQLAAVPATASEAAAAHIKGKPPGGVEPPAPSTAPAPVVPKPAAAPHALGYAVGPSAATAAAPATGTTASRATPTPPHAQHPMAGEQQQQQQQQYGGGEPLPPRPHSVASMLVANTHAIAAVPQTPSRSSVSASGVQQQQQQQQHGVPLRSISSAPSAASLHRVASNTRGSDGAVPSRPASAAASASGVVVGGVTASSVPASDAPLLMVRGSSARPSPYATPTAHALQLAASPAADAAIGLGVAASARGAPVRPQTAMAGGGSAGGRRWDNQQQQQQQQQQQEQERVVDAQKVLASSSSSTAAFANSSSGGNNSAARRTRPASASGVRGSFAQQLCLGGTPITGSSGSANGHCPVYKCGWCPSHGKAKAQDTPGWERLGQW